jgi:hypothetical protein
MPSQAMFSGHSKHRALRRLGELNRVGEFNRAKLIVPVNWRGIVDWHLAGDEGSTTGRAIRFKFFQRQQAVRVGASWHQIVHAQIMVSA